jgi:hypothetical protein
MWDWAKALLDRGPFYLMARPLAGAVLGLAVGGLYGSLGGALHAALRGTPALFVGWFLPAVAGGTAAGFIMGVCSAAERAGRGATPDEPGLSPNGEGSSNGSVARPGELTRLPTRARSLRRSAANPIDSFDR